MPPAYVKPYVKRQKNDMMAWAMMAKGERYKEPIALAA